MSKSSSFNTYRDKRDFRKTGEPRGGKKRPGKHPIYVIQKHDASSRHYDFRVEIGGVLKSWAVPKGPSTDPRVKRLAVPTEDHPLDYADFEGVIPEDQYGGGAVLVWDAGSYDNLKEDEDGNEVPMETAYRDGHLAVRLHGKKLEGATPSSAPGRGRSRAGSW